MKSSAFTQAGLLLLGGTVVLLIGAFVKFDPESSPPKAPLSREATLTDDVPDLSNELPLPPKFPAPLAQIVKLTRAGVGEAVVLAYVENAGQSYAPTADEMIYLHRSGVPDSVMAALVKQHAKTSAPPPPPFPSSSIADAVPSASASASPRESASAPPEPLALPTSPPPTPVAYNSESGQASNFASPAPAARPPLDSEAAFFFDELSPYGDWLQNGEGEWVWQPTVQQAVPDWMPYRDNGQWQFTDSGWLWQSTYPWGWAPFHYGRWSNDAPRGWTWQPGNQWAPAWVTWKKSLNFKGQAYYGWAPLPPGVSLNMEYYLPNSSRNTFALSPSSYAFVPASSFLSPNLARHTTSPYKTASLLASSVPLPVSPRPGVAPEEVAKAVHMPVIPMPLRDIPQTAVRPPTASAREVAIYRPHIQSPSSTASAKAAK